MDAIVHSFNDELASLLQTKPPVSKAKMCTITKAAMRGVKFYKHIVQIVEKFIARCRPEYKVPGLYVIDSIVRQSRHQFGPDRDVYAPRFARNLGLTFENLLNDCHEEDRARMVRVLNLWLKNGVFDSQTIRPLLDMADSPAHTNRSTGSGGGVVFQRDPKSPSSGETSSSSTKQHYSSSSMSAAAVSANLKYSNARSSDNSLKFSKNMLDFDYGEDDDDEDNDDADETPTEAEPPLSSTLNKIEMEQRIKTSNDSISSARKSSITNASNQSGHSTHRTTSKTSSKQQHQQQFPQQDPVLERWNKIIKGELTNDQPLYNLNTTTTSSNQSHQPNRPRRSRSRSPQISNEKYPQYKSNHDHHQHHQHRTSTTTSTKGVNLQQANVDINPERAAERERKCLPKIRDKHLTVCSSTLWLGHVPKMVSEADISDAFGEFGTINSIDLIPPRGCAFVCMDRRQDAKRALHHSKRLKLNGSHIRMAWAPGKGLKELKKWKDYWDSDVGASYVPYSQVDLDSVDFDQLEEGGVIDEDSMSVAMLEKRDSKSAPDKKETAVDTTPANQHNKDTGSSNQVPSSHSELPLFNQPSSLATSMQPFIVPPPPLNLGIPPPPPSMLLAQGLMPFPPPHSMSLGTNSSMLKMNQDPSDQRDNNSKQQSDRKINMVEQQLSMLQTSQNVSNQIHQQIGGGDMPDGGSLFHQLNQSDSMLFPHSQMLHMATLVNPTGSMLEPHQQVLYDGFNPNQMLLRPPMMLPFNNNQQGIADFSSMDDSYMTQQHGNY